MIPECERRGLDHLNEGDSIVLLSMPLGSRARPNVPYKVYFNNGLVNLISYYGYPMVTDEAAWWCTATWKPYNSQLLKKVLL